jgi:UPF0755 protein
MSPRNSSSAATRRPRRAPARLPRRLRLLLVLFAFLVLLGTGVAGARLASYVYAPLPAAATMVRIPRGAGLPVIARALREAGIAPWERGTIWAFRLWGDPRRVKAGVYAFRKEQRLVDVFRDLQEGRVDLVKVTVPEGLTARQVGSVLEAAGVTAAAGFAAAALHPESPVRRGLPGPSLEGYLFPDTYRFARELLPETAIDAMVQRFRDVTGELLGGERQLSGPELLGWVTLASVVEKETGSEEERPLIAAVFQNRLRLGMPLQSDPTVIYGLPGFDGNLTREDLRRDTPYNTYVRRGLPPGPIANPGRASLAAALLPPESPFLYFVSRNDGTHVFSEDYERHRKAVDEYQRRRRR